MGCMDDQALAAYCADALDPGGARLIHNWQRLEPLNALRLGGMSAKLGHGPPNLFPMAEGLRGRSPLLGVGRVHPGDIYRLTIPLAGRPGEIRCVLFCLEPNQRRRIFPAKDGPWPTMEVFQHGPGGAQLNVVLQPPYGQQVLAFVCLPAHGFTLEELDNRAEGRILDAFFEGRLPGGTHTIEVVG